MARRGKKQRKMSAAVVILGKKGVGMGFPAHVVRRTINKLLKTYGDDGWPFIEENSFRLVTETILAEQDKEQEIEKQDQEQEMGMQEDDTFDDVDDFDDWDGPVSQNVTEDAQPVTSVAVLAGSSSAMNNILDVEPDDDDCGIPSPENFIKNREPSSSVPVLAVASSPDSSKRGVAGPNPNPGESFYAGQVAPAETVPLLRARREPCYGWIKEIIDKEIEESSSSRVRKRKSGWDLDPFEWKRACSD